MNILHRLTNLVNAYADYTAKARTITELSLLSDYQLKDIGISREELNLRVKTAWVSNDTKPQPKQAVLAKAVKKPAQKAESGLGLQLVAMYSTWNRPGYVV